jgi:LuxR family maltose regulon positive regulatory protein
MNLERPLTLLERAENQGKTRGWGRLTAAAVLERARLLLNEGRIDEGAECVNRLERLAREYPAPVNCAWSDIHRYAALARGYLASAEERFDDAISILTELRRELETVHNLHLALRVGTHLAAVRLRTKQTAEAFRSFGTILTALAKAGVHHSILDEGAQVGPLLRAFREHAERTGSFRELMVCISNLIADWRARYPSEVQQTSDQSEPRQPLNRSKPKQAPSSVVAASLSARESHILKLIGEGLSNKEIARNLAITPETVKSHVKRIFNKLNVERRAQAVSRAQSMG